MQDVDHGGRKKNDAENQRTRALRNLISGKGIEADDESHGNGEKFNQGVETEIPHPEFVIKSAGLDAGYKDDSKGHNGKNPKIFARNNHSVALIIHPAI